MPLPSFALQEPLNHPIIAFSARLHRGGLEVGERRRMRDRMTDQETNKGEEDRGGQPVVERRGKFTIHYGYNSSMDLLNVLGELEQRGIDANEVAQILGELHHAGDEPLLPSKTASYLADYYRLFGW